MCGKAFVIHKMCDFNYAHKSVSWHFVKENIYTKINK